MKEVKSNPDINSKKSSDDEIFYTLQKPFTYAFKGDTRKAEFITVKAPTVSNISSVARLKQGFMKAVAGNQQESVNVKGTKDKKEDELENLTGDMIMTMLSMSDIDYPQYLETAKFMFMDGDVCLLDGEQELSKNLIAKVSIDDLEAMTGEYLKVFILSSVLRMMQT